MCVHARARVCVCVYVRAHTLTCIHFMGGVHMHRKHESSGKKSSKKTWGCLETELYPSFEQISHLSLLHNTIEKLYSVVK